MTFRGVIRSTFSNLILWTTLTFMLPLVHAERLSIRDRMTPVVLNNDVRSPEELLREAEREYGNKSYAASEAASRKALEKQKLSRKARYLLGMSLAAQRRLPEEAIENLRAAASDYPDARLEVTRILMDQGRMDEAMGELKLYLDSGQLRAK